MATMLEEMRRMAGLEPRWPEYTLGEDKLTPLEQHILKKLKTKPVAADDLTWDAPAEALPKHIDRALAHLKKLGKVQTVKQDDGWVWKLVEHYENLASPPEDPAERYDPNDGPLDHVQFYDHTGSIRTEWWFESDVKMDADGGHALPVREHAKDLEAAIKAVEGEVKLSDQEKQQIRDYWQQEVVGGREGNITLFFKTKKGQKPHFDHLDISG